MAYFNFRTMAMLNVEKMAFYFRWAILSIEILWVIHICAVLHEKTYIFLVKPDVLKMDFLIHSIISVLIILFGISTRT